MLKKILIIALSLTATACTLHPETNPKKECLQAQRESVYADTSISPTASPAAQSNTLNKNIASYC
jgi:hypothetical protein